MSDLPLEDVTVLDFCQALAGPFATVLLADLGAEVITVEPPGGGSQRRFVGGAIFPNVGRNKRSISLDLKTDEAQEILEPLTESADVVVHNFPPGTMERLGCDYDTLRTYNEDILYCAITGYGEEGPYRDRPAYDPLAQALSGLLWNTGEPDRKPSRVGASLLDMGAGVFASYAVVGVLLDDENPGGKIGVSLLDVAASFMGYWYSYYDLHDKSPSRMGHTWEPYAPYGVFETDGGPVYLAIGSERQWEKLCTALDRADWMADERFETNEDRTSNRDAIHAAIEDEFSGYDREALADRLSNRGVPVAEVQTIPEAFEDEHLRFRQAIDDVENVDGEHVAIGTNPVDFLDTERKSDPSRPPDLGEDGTDVLADLGFSASDIERYRDGDVLQ